MLLKALRIFSVYSFIGRKANVIFDRRKHKKKMIFNFETASPALVKEACCDLVFDEQLET